ASFWKPHKKLTIGEPTACVSSLYPAGVLSAMNAANKKVWLAYARLGRRPCLRQDEMRPGINVLGPGASEIACVIAHACHEASVRILVLDLSGGVSSEVSRYVDSTYCRRFPYDALVGEEVAPSPGRGLLPQRSGCATPACLVTLDNAHGCLIV